MIIVFRYLNDSQVVRSGYSVCVQKGELASVTGCSGRQTGAQNKEGLSPYFSSFMEPLLPGTVLSTLHRWPCFILNNQVSTILTSTEETKQYQEVIQLAQAYRLLSSEDVTTLYCQLDCKVNEIRYAYSLAVPGTQ